MDSRARQQPAAAFERERSTGDSAVAGGDASLAELVLRGLKQNPKRLPSALLYDSEGSRLFRRIMELPSYYLSRAEAEVLRTYADGIAEHFAGQRLTVVDLGAGDGSKTALLLRALEQSTEHLVYVPVDVSASALSELARAHAMRLPAVPIEPKLGDYTHGLGSVVESFPSRRTLALFLGSNIGNLTELEAIKLLLAWRRILPRGDHLLVGFDMLKDTDTLLRAYDDVEGVTAAFNLNLLSRLNAELGASFDPKSFHHYARFDAEARAMESFLVSERDQEVLVAGERILFGACEMLQTEISCKYREIDVRTMATAAGLRPCGWYYDERGWFLDALLEVDEALVH